MMPLPSEHAARQVDPDKFEWIKELWSAKGVRALGGPLKANPKGPTEIQTLRFDAAKFTVEEAKKWLTDNGYHAGGFEPASGAKAAADSGEMVLGFAGEGSVRLVEGAAGDDGKPKLPTFDMDLYNGGPMNVPHYGPVVIDLPGIHVPNRDIPALHDHDTRRIVGHGKAIVTTGATGGVKFKGVVSGHGEAREEVVNSGKNGFPWQASIGAMPLQSEKLEAGAAAVVNGRTVKGPLTIIRKSELREGSFVPLGADATTSAKVAASAAEGEVVMDAKFTAWLKAAGFSPDALSEAQCAKLQSVYDAEVKASASPAKEEPARTEPAKQVSAADEIKAERQRVAAIEAACKGEWSEKDAPKIEAIRTSAVAEGKDVSEVKSQVLEIVRASYAQKSPMIITGSDEAPEAKVLEAALAVRHHVMATGAGAGEETEDKRLLRAYGQETMNKTADIRGIRLSEVCAACAALEDVQLPRFGRGDEKWIRAAFSTLSLPGILSNLANKLLLNSYYNVPSVVRSIFKIGQLNDFKQHKRFRLVGDMTFQVVNAAGELPSGTLGEQTYPIQADVYGKFFNLTRQDVMNDDLGAFLEIPRLCGRGAALAVEEAGMSLLMANANSYFAAIPTDYSANYFEGAATVLGVAGLDSAVALMLKQTDPYGKPIMLSPTFLLVPPELKSLADRLFVSQDLAGISGTQLPGANTHQGKYKPVSSPYLSNSKFTGNSSVAWYLLADPQDIAAFELAFVNGRDVPQVEATTMDGKNLGLGYRAFMDFGVAPMDPRAAVKSKGAA